MPALEEVYNDGADAYDARLPYVAEVETTGVAPFLYHRWSNESVAAKAGAAKGSKAKKTDDLASYVWRNPAGYLCIPGEYLRMSVVNAARYMQDPRSPRKSAMDLVKAAVISLTELAPVRADGKPVMDWAYIDQRRVMVQRAGVTRQRPALEVGWQATFQLQVQTPEYLPPERLSSLVSDAGRLIGLGDFRPSYGRFSVTGFHLL